MTSRHTTTVLTEVAGIRVRKEAAWARVGGEDFPDGTGPRRPVLGIPAQKARDEHTARAQMAARTGHTRWSHLALDGLLSALAEDEPAAIREHLVHHAARVVAWIESLDRRLEAAQEAEDRRP